jgi:hypothetical protein
MAMPNDMLLIVKTAARRYAVRRDDVFEIRMLENAGALDTGASGAWPSLGVELGPLIEPGDQSRLVRRRGLLVPLRRRYVALLVDYVETFIERSDCAPLPALLRERLRLPWAIGALALDDDLILLLDVRAIARSVLVDRANGSGEPNHGTSSLT